MKTDYEKFRDTSPENAALLDAEARVLAAEEACAALREENARLIRECDVLKAALAEEDAAVTRLIEKLRVAERERREAQAEVKRLEGLILDADTITHWYLARCSGPVPQEAIRVQAEARRIRAQREEGE